MNGAKRIGGVSDKEENLMKHDHGMIRGLWMLLVVGLIVLGSGVQGIWAEETAPLDVSSSTTGDTEALRGVPRGYCKPVPLNPPRQCADGTWLYTTCDKCPPSTDGVPPAM